MKKNNNNNIGNGISNEGSYRFLAKDYAISDNEYETGLNNLDLIIGAPGAGKSSGYIFPLLEHGKNSMVVMDTKGILNKKYSQYLKMNGFRVSTIDFVRPRKTDVYNMLDYVGKKMVKGRDGTKSCQYSQKDIKTIVSVLLQPEMFNDDEFWIKSGQQVITALIAYVFEVLPESEQNMVSVTRLFLEMNRQFSQREMRISFFEELREENPDSYAVSVYDMFVNTVISEKTWVCIGQFVSNALDPFIIPEYQPMFAGKSSVRFEDLGRRRTVMFVNTSDSDESMDSIVNVFYKQLFQSLMAEADAQDDGRLKVPVRIVMDDFASRLAIPGFDRLISVIRSRGIYTSLILQDIAQLETMYKPAQARVIVSTCDIKIFIGPQDEASADYVARFVGCLPERVRCMGRDDLWLLIRGQAPRRLKRINPYSKDEIVE